MAYNRYDTIPPLGQSNSYDHHFEYRPGSRPHYVAPCDRHCSHVCQRCNRKKNYCACHVHKEEPKKPVSEPKKWRALDYCDEKGHAHGTVSQEAEQSITTQQGSDEWIIIRDSADIDVISSDTQVAASLQVGLQVAITVVLSIVIGSSSTIDAIVEDFNEMITTKQQNRQKTIIENSRNVEVTTNDTDVALNIQLLLQILVAILVVLDVL